MLDADSDFRIRRAAAEDAGVIAHHRAAMFRDMGSIPPVEYEEFRQSSAEWLDTLFAGNGYAGWLAEQRNTIVAGGGILIREMGPVPGCYRVNRWAHIVNVYTEPPYRRRGLARLVMRTMLDWCAEQAFDMVTLAASDEGRPLYESLGFVPTHDMRLSQRAPGGVR